MKDRIFLFTLLLAGISLPAQQVNYESTFEKAKAEAVRQRKPMAILMTIQTPATANNSTNGLKDETVIKKFNNSFINYKVAREDTAISIKLIRDYKLRRFPAFVFLDAKGGLLFSDIAFLSRPEPLLQLADKALSASKEMSLVDYDSEYARGNFDIRFLKSYILKRQQAGITNNEILLEKYVDRLSVSELNNYDQVLFILKAGPVVEGKVYRLAYTNRNLVDSIYKSELAADRSAINNLTISNSLAKAIAEKDLKLAYSLSNFVRNSWRKDPEMGQRNAQLKMLQFYMGIKDTANYLQHAGTYYDRYYMQISIDSIVKKDSLAFEAAKVKARENAVVTKVSDHVTKSTATFRYPSTNPVATELNTAARTFYYMAGNKEAHLIKALLWSKRAVELEPTPAFHDTYAHLLYKLSFYEQAEAMQKKAIELAEASKLDSGRFKDEYLKMKQRRL